VLVPARRSDVPHAGARAGDTFFKGSGYNVTPRIVRPSPCHGKREEDLGMQCSGDQHTHLRDAAQAKNGGGLTYFPEDCGKYCKNREMKF